MIEVADSNAAYYYHYDALGSVIALSDSSGDTVQTYEYSVFGEPAVEDANHSNPYMFAGRRYDIGIGLYYNRARYYNPYTGRFLQTDPVGYADGINWYKYCKNNPLLWVDPSGQETVEDATGRVMILPWRLDPGSSTASLIFAEAAGILIDVKELVGPDLPGPVSEIIDKYLEILEDTCRGLAGIAGKDQHGWRTFIETQEYADTDNDGEPDKDADGNKIALREPTWLEIRGIRYPGIMREGKTIIPARKGSWYEGCGYTDSEDAWVAAIVGMARYPSTIPERYADPMLQGPMYGKHYDASNAVLDTLIKIGEILDAIDDALPPVLPIPPVPSSQY